MVNLVNPAGPPVPGVFKVPFPNPINEIPSGIKRLESTVPEDSPSQNIIANTRQFRRWPVLHPYKGHNLDVYA